MSTDRPSDLAVRDMLVEDYQKYARSRGVNPPVRDLESLAASDMAVTERVEAESAARPKLNPRESAPRNGPTRAEIVADNLGYELLRREIPTEVTASSLPKHPKQVALEQRVRLILQQTGDAARSPSMADRPYAHPALAHAVVTEMVDCTKRRRSYRGLNDKDRALAFRRALEDIADRSTGALGPWWVK